MAKRAKQLVELSLLRVSDGNAELAVLTDYKSAELPWERYGDGGGSDGMRRGAGGCEGDE